MGKTRKMYFWRCGMNINEAERRTNEIIDIIETAKQRDQEAKEQERS